MPKGERHLRKPSVKIPGEKWKLGYLAGLIDGEGVISLVKHEGTFGGFVVQLAVYNTDERLVRWIQENFGGHVYSRDRSKTKGYFGYRKQREWKWYISRTLDVYYILFHVRDYLIVKRQKAEQVLQFLKEKLLALRYESFLLDRE